MDLSGKRILVTGGAGFIGSHLVDALVDTPAVLSSPDQSLAGVRVLDDFSTGRAKNLVRSLTRHGSPSEPCPVRGRVHPVANATRLAKRAPTSCHVEILRGDIRHADTAARAMKDIDVVFHLACRGVRHSIGHPQENHQVNASGTLTLLEAARRNDVQRFVHVSSSEVYGAARRVPMDEEHPTYPETVYGAAKLAGECYARAYHQTYGLPTVVVRPFNNYGPRSHHEGDAGEVIPRFVVWALTGGQPVIFGDGRQTRDFLFVRDTAFWLTRIAQCDALIGRTINLGSGRQTSVFELAKLIWRVSGRWDCRPLFHPPRPGDVSRHQADASYAEEALGFHIRTPLSDGIQQVINHFREAPRGLAALVNETPVINWAA